MIPIHAPSVGHFDLLTSDFWLASFWSQLWDREKSQVMESAQTLTRCVILGKLLKSDDPHLPYL